MNNPFSRFFASEPDEGDTVLSDCHDIVAFGNTPYFARFLLYLDHEADKQLEIGDSVSMIRSASRINAFKEIKAHLKRTVREAAEVLARENSDV